jgi:hypothetical protein
MPQWCDQGDRGAEESTTRKLISCHCALDCFLVATPTFPLTRSSGYGYPAWLAPCERRKAVLRQPSSIEDAEHAQGLRQITSLLDLLTKVGQSY